MPSPRANVAGGVKRRAGGASGGGGGGGGRGRAKGGKGDRAAADGRVRLHRYMADLGVASRRACESLIASGEVSVNGELVTAHPVFIDPVHDRVEVSGRPLPRARSGAGGSVNAELPAGLTRRKIYVMLNKPTHTLTTSRDEPEYEGDRRTVMDLVKHPTGARLYPVGRLDYETRGLVLLTNDGDLANRLTHPKFGVHKSYEAVVKGRLEDDQIAELEKGIYLAERREGQTVGAKRTARAELEIVRRDRERTILRVTLREGRNRQVRRMLAGVGHPVKKLTRVGMGPLKLSRCAPGEWRELDAGELRALRRAASAADRAAKAGVSDGEGTTVKKRASSGGAGGAGGAGDRRGSSRASGGQRQGRGGAGGAR